MSTLSRQQFFSSAVQYQFILIMQYKFYCSNLFCPCNHSVYRSAKKYYILYLYYISIILSVLIVLPTSYYYKNYYYTTRTITLLSQQCICISTFLSFQFRDAFLIRLVPTDQSILAYKQFLSFEHIRCRFKILKCQVHTIVG